MNIAQTDHLSIVKAFLKAVGEEGKSGDALEAFYADDVLHTEFPNAVTRNLTNSDLQSLKDNSEKGKKVFISQHNELVRHYEQGNTIVIEAVWTGILAIPLGTLPAGDVVKAYFAQFFEFEHGKIIRQRNYDCFEPFM